MGSRTKGEAAMVRRRELSDGHVFLERRDTRGELVAETVVPKELEADARELLEMLAVKWEAINADRLPPGVLRFRRRPASGANSSPGTRTQSR
jgi:hypothetical protein